MKVRTITVTRALLRKWPLPDPTYSGSKEDRGRVLIVGGSRETPGAVQLAGVAALRAGAGKLQIASRVGRGGAAGDSDARSEGYRIGGGQTRTDRDM